MIKENYRLTLKHRAENVYIPETEEIVKIIDGCNEVASLHDVRDLVRVFGNTGIRNEELDSLRIADIDFEGKWLLIESSRGVPDPLRQIPVRDKTLAAFRNLHAANPDSEFVFGERHRNRMRRIIWRVRREFPHIWRDRLVTHHLRTNLALRLGSAGLPLGVVKYVMGDLPIAELMPKLPLTMDQKLEIVRRNVEAFLPEL